MRQAGPVDWLARQIGQFTSMVYSTKNVSCYYMEMSQPSKRAASLSCKRTGSLNGLARFHAIASKRAIPGNGLKKHNGEYSASLQPYDTALFIYKTNLNTISSRQTNQLVYRASSFPYNQALRFISHNFKSSDQSPDKKIFTSLQHILCHERRIRIILKIPESMVT